MSRAVQPSEEQVIRAEQQRVSTLRMQLLQLHPFWGFLLLQVRVVAAPRLCAMAATDCLRHIWFNPLRTQHLRDAQLGFVLAHEVAHQLLASAGRQRGRNPALWNCATDYAINRMVARMEHPARPGQPLYEVPDVDLPDGERVRVLLDRRFDGMIAEVIYEHLAADELPRPRSVTLTLELDDLARPGSGGSEPAAAGVVRVPNLSDHGGGVDVHLPADLTPAARGELQERVAGAMDAWSHAGQQAGHIPGELVRRLRFGSSCQIPWQRLLRSFAGQALARDEYSLTRPNLRYLEHDVVLPGLRSERVGHVVLALDTSASVGPALLDELGAELKQICAHVERVTLLVADATVQQVVESPQLERFGAEGRFKGGGGTDHRPVFGWVAEQPWQPDLFIGLTDLYSRFPGRRPPYPVLWAAPARHGQAPWGRVIELQTTASRP